MSIGFLIICLVLMTQCQNTTRYKALELNYVDLSDNDTITAQPVLSKPLKLRKSDAVDNVIIVHSEEIINPMLSGIGGAFNEQGGESFMSLPSDKRKALAEALFNPETGAGFSLCRTAVGSSDFGLSAYSYSETPDDYEMKYFSVERDKASVLPFINAAMAENPSLKIFASPWSPPGWMKISGKMDGGTDDNREQNMLINDPEIHKAYALYFSKYVQAYAENGITIDRLLIQNETDMNPKYPGCNMYPEQMADLAFNYIRPQFEKDDLKTELWAGTFRDVDQVGSRPDAQNFMALEGAMEIDGVGLQYCPPKTLLELKAKYPELKIMHTEGVCNRGQNSIQQAKKRFSEVANWLNAGCENYCYWNMVLNETSTSAWDWPQNSLINIDRQTGIVTYNPDYATISLFSRFIRPGDQSVKVDTPKDIIAIAVKNESRLVVFLQNATDSALKQNIDIDGQLSTVELPSNSVSAVVFKMKK